MNNTSTQSDINLSGWISYLPHSWQAYVLLLRLDRPIGSWLLFLPGLWGILLPHDVPITTRIFLIILFALGSILMRGAGCIVNDIWDRDFDRQVARTKNRPIASGTISVFQAIIFLIVILIIGLLILLQLNIPARWLGASSLILVALYPGAKRITWWPQLVLGFTFGFGAPLGYTAATGHLSWAQAALYGATIAWQVGFDTIYGYQDIEDDKQVGIKSTARLAGESGKLFVSICFTICILLLIVTHILNHNAWPAIIMLSLPTLHFIWQMRHFNPHNPKICQKLFNANRDAGLLIAFTLFIGLLFE